MQTFPGLVIFKKVSRGAFVSDVVTELHQLISDVRHQRRAGPVLQVHVSSGYGRIGTGGSWKCLIID